jgi:hypothetical protein
MQYQQPYGQPIQQPADPMAYIAALEARVRALEMRLPNTSLVASGFMKRAFAVWGHMFVSSFIIGLVMSVIGGIISLVFAGSLIGALGNSGGF